MNRKIKFRAWDKKTKRFIEKDTDIDNREDTNLGNYAITFDGILCFFESEDGGMYVEEKNNVVISQYTGLKDKNGKEIYEGDIVRSMQYVNIDDEEKREFIEVVKFEGGEFFPVCEEPSKDYEVIGNIYENPGLLNK